MKFNWKTFQIDIDSFYKIIKDIPNSDGLVCDEEGILVCNFENFSSDDQNLVINYYNSLSEESESIKLNNKIDIIQKINQIKTDLLSKTYAEMSILEKKLVLNLELTDSELDFIINESVII